MLVALAGPGPWRDQEVVEASEQVYEHRKLVRNLAKSFRYESKFDSWGTAVDGIKGRVRTDDKILSQLARLGFALLAVGSASSDLLRQWTGSCIHPYSHQKALMCVFDRVYLHITDIDGTGTHKLQPRILDETLLSVLVLPFAYTNIRAPVSCRVLATDSVAERAPCNFSVVRADDVVRRPRDVII